MGAPSEGLKYFFELQHKKRISLLKDKNKHQTPLFSNPIYIFISCKFLNDLKSYGCAISSFTKKNTSLKCNDNETMPKNLKVESKINLVLCA
jgi:hypothetical protein